MSKPSSVVGSGFVLEPAARTRLYPWIVGAAGLGPSLAMAFGGFRSQSLVKNTGDPYGYGKIAHGFLEHGFDKLTRRAASLYPHLLALIYWLGGSDRSVVLLQCVLQAGTCLLAFALGSRLYNARTGLFAGLLCAVHPMFLRYVADLHMESLLTFLCTLTVWCAVRFYQEQTLRRGTALGAVGMITTLTKGVILPYVVLFGVLVAFLAIRSQPRNRRTLSAVAAMFATMAVLIAPWTYRNYEVTGGRFVLLTPGSSDSFLRGYVFTRSEFATLSRPPYTDAENLCNYWFRNIARDAGTVWEADEVVDEQNNKRVARDLILHHPIDTIRKCVVGLFTFWYEMTTLKNSLVPLVLAVFGWALTWVGWQRARREGRPTWLLVLPIVVMNVFVAVLIPLGRYSTPILPCLMVLAAFGIDSILSRREVTLSPGRP